MPIKFLVFFEGGGGLEVPILCWRTDFSDYHCHGYECDINSTKYPGVVAFH